MNSRAEAAKCQGGTQMVGQKCNYSFQLWTLVNGDEPLPTADQSKGLIFFMHRKRKYTKTQTTQYVSKLLSLIFQANAN